MISCLLCDKNPAAASIALCVDCVRSFQDRKKLAGLHAPVRRKFGLPATAPESSGGVKCNLCFNRCSMGEGECGYCGLRMNKEGKLVEKSSKKAALVHAYLDLLPTNCCSSWFCKGSKEDGYNLAVFFYGCSFDCLFCQNFSHKYIDGAPQMLEDELIARALESRVRCICFFGGSPEPHFPFALRVAQEVYEKTEGKKHICWEWNGSGNADLVKRAVELSKKSGGTVKFDLKAFHPNVHAALCGVDNSHTLENFTAVAKMCADDEDVLTATTLLVSYYVDPQEVGEIASFISKLNPRIPYSLLVFHPDFYLDDLPITPKKQVFDCYDAASRYLERVNIGNKGLL